MRFSKVALPNRSPYIPGVNSRPHSSPIETGGSIPQSLSSCECGTNEYFMYGVDLFNCHYFWEAHEAWEEMWHLERDEELRQLLQGMIQMTGGFLKILQGNQQGAVTLWTRATGRITRERYEKAGVELESIISAIERALQGESELTIERCFYSILI